MVKKTSDERKYTKVCKVQFCTDPTTGKTVARPDGCKPSEFLAYVKTIKKQGGFSVDIDDVS